MTISVSELKNGLSEFLNRAAYGRERIIVASHGKAKAAVIGMEDLHLLRELEDVVAAYEALAEHERGETVGLDQLEAELQEAAGGISG